MDQATKRLVGKWTKTRRWRALVLDVLEDQPFCLFCEQVGIVEPAQAIDHIKPHRGDEDLFWDRDNLQPLCFRCHNAKAQHERFSTRPYQPPGCDLEGRPLKIMSESRARGRVGSVAYGGQVGEAE